jgi:hypothetical protein
VINKRTPSDTPGGSSGRVLLITADAAAEEETATGSDALACRP